MTHDPCQIYIFTAAAVVMHDVSICVGTSNVWKTSKCVWGNFLLLIFGGIQIKILKEKAAQKAKKKKSKGKGEAFPRIL